MTWRVHLDPMGGWERRRLPIHLLDEWPNGGGYEILGPGGATATVVTGEQAVSQTDRPDRRCGCPRPPHPPCSPSSPGTSGPSSTPEQLRKDYEHERARVDRMLDRMLDELGRP